MGKMATREAYGKALAALAAENNNVVVLDADLAGSTKTGEFKKVAPERFFDMGIAEAGKEIRSVLQIHRQRPQGR